MNKSPFEGILLVCDMDGTLLNSKNEVSSENLEALKRFAAGGGYFTIATGRSASGVSRYCEQLPVNMPVVIMNGGQIYDFTIKKALWKSYIGDNAEEVLEDLISNFPQLGAEIFTDDMVYAINENDVTEWHRRKEDIHPGCIDMELVSKPWYKIVLAWDNYNLKKVEEYLNGKELGSIRAVFSEEVFLDLLDVTTSKGYALKELKRLYDGVFSKVIAMGDNLNDLEMIKAADIGVAVENACDALKESAQFCACHHEKNAVAHVIEWLEDNL